MVFVVGSGGDKGFVEAQTLGEFRRGVTSWAAGRGEVITALTLNGRDAAEIEDSRDIGVSDALQVATRPTRDALGDAIDEARGYIPRLARAISDSAGRLASGGEGEALSLLGQCMDGLEWCHRLFALAATFVAGGDGNGDGAPWPKRLRGYEGALAEASDALGERDLVRLADALQFMVHPELAGWLAESEALAAAVAARQ
jgi:hypothetical protein